MTASQNPANAALTLRGVDKSFGPVHANQDVSLSVTRGTIHGIVGENGAGKSTLMNILYGYYQADRGQIWVNGQQVHLKNSQQAIALGIGMVHQHFMLVEDFTVLENIILGSEKQFKLTANLSGARSHVADMAQQYDLGVDPDSLINQLGVGQQQRVELLKALYRGAQILILDEPTAVLTPDETDHLFRILLALKAQGKTVILITHKLREILEFTDVVTVMRGGKIVDTVATSSTDAAHLAEMMVGRSVVQPRRAQPTQASEQPASQATPLLEVQQLGLLGSRGEVLLADLNFSVYPGEIVGIAGVAGNGQSELLDILSGIRTASSGSLRLRGQVIKPEQHATAAQFRAMGIAHVPEDRLKNGVVKNFSCAENAILGSQRQPALRVGSKLLARLGTLSRPAITRRINDYIARFDIRPPLPEMKMSLLSGGNQQKLVLAREIERNADLVLIGQPTRGVDIGAIEMIHQTLLDLRQAGKAIILVSVELDEIMALSDRIIVMCGGKITGCVHAAQAERAQLGQMMGGKAA
jgi:general nucleoside transport system ATP-binding protein